VWLRSLISSERENRPTTEREDETEKGNMRSMEKSNWGR
jgi:hypothetical protein